MTISREFEDSEQHGCTKSYSTMQNNTTNYVKNEFLLIQTKMFSK